MFNVLIVKMDVISVGGSCVCRQEIDKHKKIRSESHFFDWVFSSFRSVIQLLTCHDIHQAINAATVKHEGFHNDKLNFRMTYFDDIRSIHDICEGYTELDVAKCVEKYIRRYHRLIDHIRKKRRIYFLRTGHVTDDEVADFFNALDALAPTNRHVLVVIHDGKQPISHHPRCIFKDIGNVKYWEDRSIWNSVFKEIEPDRSRRWVVFVIGVLLLMTLVSYYIL